jgi:hypothetical protein
MSVKPFVDSALLWHIFARQQESDQIVTDEEV